MNRALHEVAEKVGEQAARLTPRGETGKAAERFVVDENLVGNEDPFFHLIEWGSVNNPVYAPLRRAARALGLRFEDTGRQ